MPPSSNTKKCILKPWKNIICFADSSSFTAAAAMIHLSDLSSAAAVAFGAFDTMFDALCPRDGGGLPYTWIDWVEDRVTGGDTVRVSYTAVTLNPSVEKTAHACLYIPLN